MKKYHIDLIENILECVGKLNQKTDKKIIDLLENKLLDIIYAMSEYYLNNNSSTLENISSVLLQTAGMNHLNSAPNYNLPYLSLPPQTSKDIALQVFINMNTNRNINIHIDMLFIYILV